MWKISVPFILALAIVCGASGQTTRTDTVILHFTFDRSNVRPIDSGLLVPTPDRSPDSILIVAYTDTTGSERYNQKLSLRRALAVQTAVRHSLAMTTPLRLEARGETDPLPGDDSLSRRVLVIIHYHVKDNPAEAAIPPPAAHREGEPDTVIPLDNIRFVANTPVLTDEAKDLLPKITPQLMKFNDRFLEINGYCNAPGPPLPEYDPLFKLSVARAKYIYEYLIGQGFDSTHLRYIGRGNASPLNPNPVTKAQMDQNMRVEIKVFREFPPH
jgi:outer membrane protein OmpA-like peptidoglycan-associated protein